MTDAAARSDADRNRFPSGIPYIVGNEGAERFSYYGMRAILYVYLAHLFVRFASDADVPPDELAAAKARSTEIAHLFMAGVYAFPLIGAILADRLLGKFKVILWVSMIYCAGHAVLAVAGRLGELDNYRGAELGMFAGLTLIAIGSGGIKPCVSANVGDQFTAKNSHLVTKVFQIFYFIINFGSFFSTLLTPFLYSRFGPEVAFGVPGVLMFVATVVFWMGRRKFVPIAPNPGGSLGLLDTCSTVLLFSPLFGLIYGKFVLWDQFVASTEATGLGRVGPAFYYYKWLLLAVAACVACGVWLFFVRQRRQPDTGFLAVMLYTLRNRKDRRPGDGFFDVARRKFGDEAGDGPPAVLKIMVVFSMVSMFWALFDQHASTWIEQANQMDLNLTMPSHLWLVLLYGVPTLAAFGGTWLLLMVSNVRVPGKVTWGVLGAFGAAVVGSLLWDLSVDEAGRYTSIQLEAAQVSAMNPLMVMIIIPLLNVAVWGPLARKGITVSPLRKMTLGMFLAAAAFAVAAGLQQRIESAGVGEVHALWQVIQYLVMTTAEVLVSVTGLEFAYTQAPRAMKSTIMGFWLLCVTFGNLIVAFLAPLQAQFALSGFFWLFAGLMGAAAVVFAILAAFYRGKVYLQQE